MPNEEFAKLVKKIAEKIFQSVTNARLYNQKLGSSDYPDSSIKLLYTCLSSLMSNMELIGVAPEEEIKHDTVIELYNEITQAITICSKYAKYNAPYQELDRILKEGKSELAKLIPGEKIPLVKSNFISPNEEHLPLELQFISLNEKLMDAEEKLELQRTTIEKNSDYLKEQVRLIRAEIVKAEETAKESIKNLEEYVNEKKRNLDLIEDQLSNQQGLLSGKMLAGGYAQQAEEEKNSANSMRTSSVLCLVTILLVVIYSLIELSGGEITIERSLVKLGLLLFLLAPAAYLARESTKHRNEHYALKQTALDLNAIGPFIASLNKEEQDLIKTKIAERLFCSNRDKQDANTFPINAHEVIIKLIERFEPGEKPKKDKPNAAPPT